MAELWRLHYTLKYHPTDLCLIFCFSLEQEQADRILVTGCLNHKELGLLLPMASISLVTSKATEAFGMVSVEAMSAGQWFELGLSFKEYLEEFQCTMNCNFVFVLCLCFVLFIFWCEITESFLFAFTKSVVFMS